MKKQTSWIVGLVYLSTAALLGCRPAADEPHGHGHGQGHEEEEADRGPHGGRMLRDGDLAVELAIFERGIPPEYRAWVAVDASPVDADDVRLAVELDRFGKRKDQIQFTEHPDGYLRGDRTVDEPHSFLVTVRAEHSGRTHEWSYESFEGRTEISPENAAASGIGVDTAGPARIRKTLHAVGRVTPDLEVLARIVPTYPGTVREVRKAVGDRVAAGERLAVVEASQTLRRYDLRSPVAGTVLSRDVAEGEVVADRVLYTVADLSTLWVELLLKPADAAHVRAGQPVRIRSGEDLVAVGEVELVSPTASAQAQTVVARAVISNESGAWRPGLMAEAEIVVDEVEVPIAVRPSALQTFRDWDVVFLNDGAVFQAMPVELGRRDEDWVEALEGVPAGQRYAATGSFVVKADVEKSGATHDH